MRAMQITEHKGRGRLDYYRVWTGRIWCWLAEMMGDEMEAAMIDCAKCVVMIREPWCRMLLVLNLGRA